MKTEKKINYGLLANYTLTGLPRNLENWKKGNFLIKSGKTLKSQGKKSKKHKSQGMFLHYLCVSVACIKL